MFKQTDIEVANKTSRANGAIGNKAITPKHVREFLSTCKNKDITILDFGAGKTAVHAAALKADGFNCTAYEFGKNSNPIFHDETALNRQYDIVYASNVLNVQSSIAMAEQTIKQISDSVKSDGRFFANFPLSPRKIELNANEMRILLLKRFRTVERLRGSAAAAVWECIK